MSPGGGELHLFVATWKQFYVFFLHAEGLVEPGINLIFSQLLHGLDKQLPLRRGQVDIPAITKESSANPNSLRNSLKSNPFLEMLGTASTLRLPTI